MIAFSPITSSVFDITSIPEVIRFQLTWTSFDKPPVRGEAFKGKRKPTQNIFLKDSDLKGITVRDRVILPDFEETKFGLALICSCDIATKREGAKICYGLPMDFADKDIELFDNRLPDFTTPLP